MVERFLTASEAAALGINRDVVIHSEITAIENRILQELNNGFRSAIINSTTMTSQPTANVVVVSSVDINTNIMTIPSTFILGSPVYFTTTGTLPGNIITSKTYYLVPISSTTYKIAETKQNSMQTTPIIVDITSAGSGTLSLNVLSESQLYYQAWQNVVFNPDLKIYSQRMTTVIDYFVSLGYSIVRLKENNSNIMNWSVTW